MRILLISKTQIITKIFELVSKKLLFDLFIQENIVIDDRYDFIIVDEDFIDDEFNNLKEYCKRLGAISHEEISINKLRDFLIKRPFLPKELYEILKEEFQIVKELNSKKEKKNNKPELNDLESLVQNIANDIENEFSNKETKTKKLTDEEYVDEVEDENDCIVKLTPQNFGGVLDKSELSKITTLLDSSEYVASDEKEVEDWNDLSDIIDKAIDEVRDYDFYEDENNNVELVLSRFKLDELKPLLNKLNQKIIDNLSNGETVNLQIRLKAENSELPK